MEKDIEIKEDSIEVVIKVNNAIVEFDEPYDKIYFESRYQKAEKLILVAYVDSQPAGYMVSYKKDEDGSLYCWMAGVDPQYRRLGLLHKMMNYLSDWAKSKGYNRITIKTRNNRREMLAYLVKVGFNFIEVQPQPFVIDNRILLEKIIS